MARSNKRWYEREVENLLLMYPALKASLQHEFPAAVAAYGPEAIIRGAGVSDPTGTWAARRERNLKIVQAIDAALAALNEDEQRFVELRYFDTTWRNDVSVYLEMGVSERTGRRLKQQALRKIATALQII